MTDETDANHAIADLAKAIMELLAKTEVPDGVKRDSELRRGTKSSMGVLGGVLLHEPNGTATFTIRINGGARDT